MENKKQAKQTQLDKYYKSIINQDKCAVVICNLSHIIIDMNQAAIERYAKQGGEKLIGQSIMDCHNAQSREKMEQIVAWFGESATHNIVYTFYNEKENKDVYMVALRDGETLIGYYEKHEYRDKETMKMYDLW